MTGLKWSLKDLHLVVVVVVEKHLKMMHTPLQYVTIRRENKKTLVCTLMLVQKEQLDRLTATIDLEVSQGVQSP